MLITYKIMIEKSNKLHNFIDLCIVEQDIALPIPNIGELVLLNKTLYRVVHKVIALDEDKVPYKINIVLEDI